MNELIKIESAEIGGETIQTCNARDLHTKLGVGKDFSTWIKDRIEKYGFEEGVDFVRFSPNSGKTPSGGRPTVEYYISLPMAKELSMVENSEIGRQLMREFSRVAIIPLPPGARKGCRRKAGGIEMNKQEIEKVVTNPPHYAGVTVEPIDVAQCYGFLMGNAIKYLVRAGKKEGASEESDLRKAKFYLERWLTIYSYEGASMIIIKAEDETGAFRRLAASIWLLSAGNLYLQTLFNLNESAPAPEFVLANLVTRVEAKNVIEMIDENLKEFANA